MTEEVSRPAEQLSPRTIIVLSLLPGAMTLVFGLLAAPAAGWLGAPMLLIRFMGPALFIGVFELAILRSWGQRTSGTRSLDRAVVYRDRMPWWQYVLCVMGLLVWGFAASSLLSPLTVALREGLFAWMPPLFTMDPATLDPSLYARWSIIATVLLGIISTGIFIPVVEELYYRGFLLPRMSRLGWLAPIFNVALWATNHFFEPWSIIQFFCVFVPVATVVHWKRNVYVGVAAHVLANLLAVLPMITWLAH